MMGVGDDLNINISVEQPESRNAGFAVMYAPHCIENVGYTSRPCIVASFSLGICGI